jgi:hypothetical protein
MRSDPVGVPDPPSASHHRSHRRSQSASPLVLVMSLRHHFPKIRPLVDLGRLAAVLTVGAGVLAPSSTTSAQGFAGAGLTPRDATASLRVESDELNTGWVELALDAIELTRGPIRAGWESSRQLRSRLAPESVESIHAVGIGGRHWLHAMRWSDPIAVELGLQRLGSRPMGAGRFRLPALGVEIAIAGEWLLVCPSNCPWLDHAVDLARGGDLAAAIPMPPDAGPPPARSPVEILLHHAEPIGGASAIGIRPSSPLTAEVTLSGRYDASPLPIRTAARMDLDVAGRFDGRVAFAAIESGIGLLDPRMIEASTRHPRIIPDADLRRQFAARRLVVFDGAPVRVEPVGLIEVPAACVAVPLRDDADAAVPDPALLTKIDAWLESAAMSFREAWNEPATAVVRMRGDEVRHLSLAPGLARAAGGHPMALSASLNWTLHATTRGGTWLVAGTSPSLVRRVTATLDESTDARSDTEIASLGVASPNRLALQIAELAQLRRLGGDAESDPDADLLAAASAFLDRVERLSWKTTRQDGHVVRGTAEVRLVPGETGSVSVARPGSLPR